MMSGSMTVVDPPQEDFVDELLGGQNSPDMDDSLEVPECGVCTSVTAVNG